MQRMFTPQLTTFSIGQLQTRSSDEPMTTFVFCNDCGNRWKFCWISGFLQLRVWRLVFVLSSKVGFIELAMTLNHAHLIVLQHCLLNGRPLEGTHKKLEYLQIFGVKFRPFKQVKLPPVNPCSQMSDQKTFREAFVLPNCQVCRL